MNENAKLNRLHDVLIANWAVSEETHPTTDQLLEALAERVEELLDQDLNRLTTAMYTLDIDETRFNEAMGATEVSKKPMAVAVLILEREMQKVESRLQYEEMKRSEAKQEPADPLLEENRNELESD